MCRIIEQSTDAIIAVDGSGVVQYVNPGAERLFGYDLIDYRQTSLHDLFHGNHCAPGPYGCDLLRLAHTHETLVDLETSVFDRLGNPLQVSLSTSPLELGAEGTGFLLTFRDCTRRRLDQAAARKGQDGVQGLVEADVVGVVYGDRHTVRGANDYFLQMLGYTRPEIEAGIATWAGITAPEHLPSCTRVLDVIERTGLCPTFEKEYMRRDGTRVPVLIGGIRTYPPLGAAPAPDFQFLVMVVDQTERKALEQRVQQAEKLEGIAVLAGGIAHDFNNLLTIIGGYSRLLLNKFPEGVDPHDQINEIDSAATKAVELTRRLMAFSRRQTGEPTVIHLPAFVHGIRNKLTAAIGNNVELVISSAPDTGHVRVDPDQIELLIRHLVENACDAMPEGGKLFIETSRISVATPFAAMCLGTPEGTYAMLAVSDTGQGMSPEVQARIFEPFFTTKPHGKGTGLGLSTVYGIVKQSGGHIRVHSTIGLGTAIRVFFPVAQTSAIPDRELPTESSSGGLETILLVDDESGLRKYVRELLDAQGYTTLDASNGTDAVLIAKHYKGRIDLLLTDIVLPGMSGVEIIQKVRELRPNIPVVRMSGYTDRFGINMDADTPYIQKPFTEAQLLRCVREALASATGTGS